jgi:cysteinyl-tRNA synthetase
MSWKHVGESFDIHGGGTDLIFPHHENEIAQSLCAFPGSRFARYWVHNEMLNVDGAKMSKSLGNFFTIRDVLAKAPAEAIRMALLRAHYHSVLDYSEEMLAACRADLDRFYRAMERTPPSEADVPEAVMHALCDDLNTPAAFAAMHALADRAMAGDGAASGGLLAAGRLLGLLEAAPAEWFRGGADSSWIEAAIAERLAARKARDFARADAIRADLASKGVLLEDGPGGTTWRRA